MVKEEKLETDEKLNLFISYSNKNLDEATKVQQYFEKGGVSCFLSKNKLKPSDEYKKEIFNTILSTDVFILILSKDFKESDWCSQEAGMAYLLSEKHNVELYCLMLDNVIPYGFLSKFHGEDFYSPISIINIAKKIDENLGSNIVANVKEFHKNSIENKIKKLNRTQSYVDASSTLNFLSNHSNYLSKEHINMIIRIAGTNKQIYECFICDKHLENLITKFEEVIDLNLLEVYYSKRNR